MFRQASHHQASLQAVTAAASAAPALAAAVEVEQAVADAVTALAVPVAHSAADKKRALCALFYAF